MSDPQIEEPSWECTRCTYHNHAALHVCELCEAPKLIVSSLQRSDGVSDAQQQLPQQDNPNHPNEPNLVSEHIQEENASAISIANPEENGSDEQVQISYAWISPPQVLSPCTNEIHPIDEAIASAGDARSRSSSATKMGTEDSTPITGVLNHVRRDIFTYQYPISPEQQVSSEALSPEISSSSLIRSDHLVEDHLREKSVTSKNSYPYYRKAPSVQQSSFHAQQPIPRQMPASGTSTSSSPWTISAQQAISSSMPAKPPSKPVFCRLKATLLVVGARYHGTFVLTEDEIEFKGHLVSLGIHPSTMKNKTGLDRIASLLGTDRDTPKRVSVRISMANLRLVLSRTYFRIPIAMELFTFLKSPAYSTFLVFDQNLTLEQALRQRSDLTRERDTVLNLLRKLIRHPIEQSPADVLRELDLPKRWVSGTMSTYDYLSWINIVAGRSFHDITKYPIFPVILAPGTGHSLNLSDRRAFRDLTQPLQVIASKALGLDPLKVTPKVKVSTWDAADGDDKILGEDSKMTSPKVSSIDDLPVSPTESEAMHTKRKPIFSDLLPEALASYPPMFYGSPATMLAPAMRDSRILRASIELNSGYLGFKDEADIRDFQFGEATTYSLGAATISSVEQVLRKAFTDRCAASEIAPFWFCGDSGRVHVMGDDIIFVPDEADESFSHEPHETKSIHFDQSGEQIEMSDDVLYDVNGNEEHSVGPPASYLSPVHRLGDKTRLVTAKVDGDDGLTNLRSMQAILETSESSHTVSAGPSQMSADEMNANQIVGTDMIGHTQSFMSPTSTVSNPIVSPSSSTLSQRKLRLTNVFWLSATDLGEQIEVDQAWKGLKTNRGKVIPEVTESKDKFHNELISDIRHLPLLPRCESSTSITSYPLDLEVAMKNKHSRRLKGKGVNRAVAAITDTLRRLTTPVVLPMWSVNDPDIFLRLHRAALESPIVSTQLHKWIDMVFGVNQQGPGAEALGNVYFPSVYLRTVPPQPQPRTVLTDHSVTSSKSGQHKFRKAEKDPEYDQITEQSDIDVDVLFEAVVYGTCPELIFTSPHPQRSKLF